MLIPCMFYDISILVIIVLKLSNNRLVIMSLISINASSIVLYIFIFKSKIMSSGNALPTFETLFMSRFEIFFVFGQAWPPTIHILFGILRAFLFIKPFAQMYTPKQCPTYSS